MTTKDDAEKTDVEPVQIWSAKELEAEFNTMLKAYRDKETEMNWEAREKAITRLRGILRGNASEKYLDTLIPLMKQMVDGIVKALPLHRAPLYRAKYEEHTTTSIGTTTTTTRGLGLLGKLHDLLLPLYRSKFRQYTATLGSLEQQDSLDELNQPDTSNDNSTELVLERLRGSYRFSGEMFVGTVNRNVLTKSLYEQRTSLRTR
ncbi:hypothetical protein K501DRAFT_273002 [Backusella circina FSU 941]|nr:hypothetical protein K501DRAFT_273002 [Backusella circina FSU 941]